MINGEPTENRLALAHNIFRLATARPATPAGRKKSAVAPSG